MLIRIYSCVLHVLLCISVCGIAQFVSGTLDNPTKLKPTVMVAFLVRNKAHTLPYFLHYLQNLNYPKQRMVLWVRADHNVDNSVDVLEHWLETAEKDYHWVDYQKADNGHGYESERGPCDWPHERFTNVLALRQEALDSARKSMVDYLLFTDVDNFLLNEQVLFKLMEQDRTIVAPMLNVTASEHYSNFWGAMADTGYYARSENYKDIQLRHISGCHKVALVHSTMLLDLRSTESLSLGYYPSPPAYRGPHDDIIIFAHSAKYHDVSMYILNDDFYGYMQMPMEGEDSLEREIQQFVHLQTETIVYHQPLMRIALIDEEPARSKLGFDQVYMINLERQLERGNKMQQLFAVLGIDAKTVYGVDGRQLNETYLKDIGVEMVPGYSDYYSDRPMTMGEIGCFLSHYKIWNETVEKGYDKVLVFEDDIRFDAYFKENLNKLTEEAATSNIDWDLIYIGRKQLKHKEETFVPGSERLVWVAYSYWTLGYMLSQRGAQKLLAQKPLGKLVPVDEYLPIMFDKNPHSEWAEHFSPRDLVALSVYPLLVYPTHYTGEPGYHSDTEYSDILRSAGPQHTEESKEPSSAETEHTLEAEHIGSAEMEFMEESEESTLQLLGPHLKASNAVHKRDDL